VSHLLADLATPERIAPLWPFSQHGVSLGLIRRTGDHRETLVVLGVALALAAGELYGRALVVFAAQHCASQLVLPTAKRRGSVLPGSHRTSRARPLSASPRPCCPPATRSCSARSAPKSGL
jgi:hypothetical protein